MIFEADKELFLQARERGIDRPEEFERAELVKLLELLDRYDLSVRQAGKGELDMIYNDKEIEELREIGRKLGLSGAAVSNRDVLARIEERKRAGRAK